MTVTGRKATFLVVALIASLSANVFVGGLFAARYLKGPHEPHFPRSVRHFLSGLPEDARPVVRAAFEARRQDMRDQFQAVREARREVGHLMRAEQIDAPALEAALAEMRRREAEVRETVHRTIVDALVDLPPEARAQWAPSWRDRR